MQDADAEYEPLDYLVLLDTIVKNKADVVFGSRYQRQECRRGLYFWHTWMNRTLTFLSNMFTNLDIRGHGDLMQAIQARGYSGNCTAS